VGPLAALERLWEERVVPGLREQGAEVVAGPAWAQLPEATPPAPGVVQESWVWVERVGPEPPFAHSKAEVQELCLGQPRADRHSPAVYCPDQPRGLGQPRADRHWATELTSPLWLEEEEEEEQRRASRGARY